MGNFCRLWTAVCLALALCGPMTAGAAAEGDVDAISLAALLVSDGHWDRAEATLAGVDPEAKGVDVARYHTLMGLIRLHGGQNDTAITHLSAALAAGQTDASARLYLAQAHLGAGDPAAALRALDAGGEAVAALEGAWVLRARAHRAAGETEAMWQRINEGLQRFPEAVELHRLKLYGAIELGLYQEAKALAPAYLSRANKTSEPWLALAEALRRSGDIHGAQMQLEEARLRFPGDSEVQKLLARTYLDDARPLAAGVILSEAAIIEPTLAVEAAECFRLGGALSRAMFMNSQVPEAGPKAKQRLGLALERGDWERAAALEPRLSRLGLLDDDRLRYALAYANYRAGDVDQAETLLAPIADAEVFSMALELRGAIAACRDAPGGC